MSHHHELANALEAGNTAEVLRLAVAHPELVNSPDWTPPPLHCAVLWNQPAAAEVLLDHGADIELRDPDRSTTPLRYAVLYCKAAMIRLLHARGANTGSIVDGGSTLLQLATEAADGAYEEYDDMPPRSEYTAIVDLLKELGVE